MTLKDLQKEAHAVAKEKGWHDEPRGIAHLIALCHSELSEALEIGREGRDLRLVWFKEGKPEGFQIELADLIIRVADMAECLGMDLEEAIKIKMAYNRIRPYKHGKKF